MTGLTLSATEVEEGDTLTYTATVVNSNSGTLLLSGAETVPVTYGPWTEVLMQPGEARGFELVRTVSDLPGLYAPRLRLGGLDPTMVYVAQQEIPGQPIRVRRAPIPILVRDRLTASLGPSGDDRVEVFLARGQKVVLDFRSSMDWDGSRMVRLLDPSGYLRKWTPGKVFRARSTGVHRVEILNDGGEKGSYGFFTDAAKRPARARGKGLLDGTAPAEIPFTAWGRTTALLQVKGPKALAPRITALRSPSGATVAIVPGAEVLVEEFGEDGTWTAIVEGNPGVAGKARVVGRPTWLDGMQQTR